MFLKYMRDVYYNRMQQYFDNILSKYQCSFRKDYKLQHCLITMIEKMA